MLAAELSSMRPTNSSWSARGIFASSSTRLPWWRRAPTSCTLFEFLKASGLPYPETCLASDAAALSEALIGKFGFPLILKPRFGSSSINVFTARSRDQVSAYLAAIPDPIAQQYIGDDKHEYTATTLSGPDGRVRAAIVLHRDLLQGTTYRTELCEDPDVLEQTVRIANALGTSGVCNFQFRLCVRASPSSRSTPGSRGPRGSATCTASTISEMTFELFRLKLPVEQPKLTRAVVLRYWNEILRPDATFQVVADRWHGWPLRAPDRASRTEAWGR